MVGRLNKNYHWLNEEIVDNLYQRALNKQLSQQQIQSIRKLLDSGHSKFIKLHLENQKKLIKYVLSSPALLPQLWNKRLDELLRSQGNG
ncbi:hypothetical protein [Aeribacillus alveayuensis]|uniref:Uncharacterized protein n=1 Tax=Aeribacillus alveayuensis TaxID=279215 RepID=A0ABT9VNH1_9BACI|nr:hypothetical protein [Bacillus alveayuensis]